MFSRKASNRFALRLIRHLVKPGIVARNIAYKNDNDTYINIFSDFVFDLIYQRTIQNASERRREKRKESYINPYLYGERKD